MSDRLYVLLGFMVGLGPTFGLLWAVMAKYESRIADRDTSMSFIIGIFAGIIVVVSHLFFTVYYSVSAVGIISAFGLGLAECLLYYIYLNRRKIRSRPDKPFLGLAFALGVSSMYIAFLMGQMVVNVEFQIEEVLGMILFAIGVSTMRGSMGIMMSRTSRRKHLVRYAGLGALILGAFNVNTLFYLIPELPFLYTFSIPAAALGLLSFRYFFRDLEFTEKYEEETS